MDCASLSTQQNQQKLTESSNKNKKHVLSMNFPAKLLFMGNSELAGATTKHRRQNIFASIFSIFHLSSIALGNGPDGYRATFNNIAAYGVSNLTVSNVRSDIETLQFQLTFEIPRIRTRAKYRSSGVLILIQASGSGDYWGDYGEYFIVMIKIVQGSRSH